MEIIFSSDIINYKKRTPIDRFTPKKNWGIKHDVVLSENNSYKAEEGDCIYDDFFRVIYQVIRVVNNKTITIAPWGDNDAINIIPEIGYKVAPKRKN